MGNTFVNRKYLDLAFDKNNSEALVTSSRQTRLWYTGIDTSDGWIVIERHKAYLFVDSRYIEYATNSLKDREDIEIILTKSFQTLKEFFESKKYKAIMVESDYEILANVDLIKKNNPGATVYRTSGQKLRILKTEDEIEKLQKAIDISMAAYRNLMSIIKEGDTEKEIDRRLNFLMKAHGADKECFDNIIAFGPNSAMPHHHPTNRALKKGDLLKIDFGAKYKGYGADITRTVIFGEPSESSAKAKEILEIVSRAAQLGRKAVRPGVKASEIDKVCRDYITQQGYGEFFLHSTGHGLGIDVHELPSVNGFSDVVLEEGMVITVEPGIYIKGFGGARIEDDILVTRDGSRTLSRKYETNGVTREFSEI